MLLPRIRNRLGALALSAGALLLACAPAQAADITASQVAEGVYVFEGAGDNVTALSDGGNLLVIDGGLEENASDLYAAIQQATGAGAISTLINTHWHPEVVGLNALAGESGATIIAHDQTDMYLRNRVSSTLFEDHFGPVDAKALPTQLTRLGGEMEFAGHRVVYGYLPAAHTNGDLYVFLPERNVLVAGGVVGGETWPLIDFWNGAFIGGLVQAYEALGEIVADDTIVIPARGAPITGADVTRLRDMYRQLFRDLAYLMNQGMGYDDVVAINPLRGQEAEFGDLIASLDDPSVFLDGAYRSWQQAEVPD